MIQATIPAGVTSLTVHGLHQWDYGQQLQLRADGLPSLVEVHFGCPGMKEAEVRVAPLTDGAVTVSIPDRCLEQSAPITAWVYFVDETSGRTALELTLPVSLRLKPAIAGSSEDEEKAGDKYDQLFGLVEEAYDAIEACKTVEANTEAAQASADASASSAQASAGSASQASTSATEAAASASGAKASEEACQAHLTTALTNFFEGERRVYLDAPTQDGLLIYCSEDAGQYYHAYLEDEDGSIINFGLIFWDGLHTVTSGGPVGTAALSLQIVPDTGMDDSAMSSGVLKQYRAGKASVWMTNILYGDQAPIENSNQTLYIRPLTGEHHTPE